MPSWGVEAEKTRGESDRARCLFFFFFFARLPPPPPPLRRRRGVDLNLDLLDTPSFPFAPSAFPAQNLQNQPNQTLHS